MNMTFKPIYRLKFWAKKQEFTVMVPAINYLKGPKHLVYKLKMRYKNINNIRKKPLLFSIERYIFHQLDARNIEVIIVKRPAVANCPVLDEDISEPVQDLPRG